MWVKLTSLTRPVSGVEAQSCILLPERRGAAYPWVGAVKEQSVEPLSHGWGLGGGPVQQV